MKRCAGAIAVLLMSLCIACANGVASAGDLITLKRDLTALDRRLEHFDRPNATEIVIRRGSELERHEAAEPDNDIPGGSGITFVISPDATLPVAAHEVAISGYVKGDLSIDLGADRGDSFSTIGIAAGASPDGHVRLHARQSRMRIRTSSATAVGPVRTRIEADFFGTAGNQARSNASSLRLRHAYGEWQFLPGFRVLVGQTSTNFSEFVMQSRTVDFSGAVGETFARQGQVRLTYENGPWVLSAGVENPETDLIDGGVFSAGTNCSESATNLCEASDGVPDFTLRTQYEAPGGEYAFQVSGLVRRLKVDRDVAPGGIAQSTVEHGWGVMGAAMVGLNENIRISASGLYGRGIGRYLSIGSGVVSGPLASPNLDVLHVAAASAALQVDLSDTLESNIVAGFLDVAGNGRPAGSVDTALSLHANLIWQPNDRLRLGIETIYGRMRRTATGTGDAVRIAFATWFFF